MTDSQKIIDIRRVIQDKNPKLLKWLPSFVLKYLKRILHEDEVNEILTECEGMKAYEFSTYIVDRFNIDVKTHNLDAVPKEGGIILAVNHPLGGMDAMALITALYPHRSDFMFVVNDILMNIANLKDRFIGVNKHGGNSKMMLLELNKTFASDQVTIVFPAGLVSRKSGVGVQDLQWQKTFVTRAKKFKRDIVPVHVDGELSSFFYNLANYRTNLGIKSNIEMLYLVNETFKQKDKTINLHFGEPISYEQFDKSKKDVEWAQWVRDKVYTMNR